MEESDALARLRNGDIAGLKTLVTLYQSQALDVAYIIGHDRPLAEDKSMLRQNGSYMSSRV